MKTVGFIFLCALLSTLCASGQIVYDASGISDALKADANVVTRTEEISFEVVDLDRAHYKVHRVYTVLNKQGEDRLFFSVYTNKYKSIEDCDIRVYDKTGGLITKYKRKDLNKHASTDGLVSEGMYSYVDIVAPTFPVTVDLNYEIAYSGTLFYPDYQIQEPGEAVQQSSYLLKVPKDLGARFKEQQISLKPEITESEGNILYKWTVSNLTAFKSEKNAVSSEQSSPAILLAPNKFKLYNTYGDMTSWKSFGLWERDLIKNIDELPQERVAFFKSLTGNAPSEKEKVALVYKYLQENFRYVSIQLGIGGYQPFTAKFTDEKKYGDCKALSFYTYSVLKALGIKSHIALINAEYNQEPVDAAFPTSHFNHMILCVPQKADSIWLECTSKTSDFNYLGSFTENRNALLITDEGGVLVRTPSSNPAHNKMSFSTVIHLNEDGSGQTSSTLCVNGDRRSAIDEMLTSKNDDQKDFIVKDLGFKQPDDFKLKKLNTEDLQIDLDIEKIPQFATGSKMFLNPRIYDFWSRVLPSAKDRKQDYFFENVVDKTDTTIYQLPADYIVDVLPIAASKTCGYASYSTSYGYNKDKNQLISTARLVLYKNRIPADEYAGVKSFFDYVVGDAGQKLVIRKN